MRKVLGLIILAMTGAFVGCLSLKCGYSIDTWKFWAILIILPVGYIGGYCLYSKDN